jgi:ferredoxin-NADP reductase
MAANPKTLRIVGARALGAATRALEIECVGGPPLAAIGGKYVIVHTGAMAGDKPIKRAYSLVSVGGHAHRAQLTVKRLGAGSDALHAAAVGTELSFSGPWGKLVPESGLDEPTLLVATDTGITAAMGVAEEHARSARGCVEVLWLRTDDETFLDVEDVRQRVNAAGAHFVYATIPPVRSIERVAAAWSHIDGRVAELRATILIASGDGAIIHGLRDRMVGAASSVRDVRIECFFHNPEKKSA